MTTEGQEKRLERLENEMAIALKSAKAAWTKAGMPRPVDSSYSAALAVLAGKIFELIHS